MDTDSRKRRRSLLAATSALAVAAGIAVVSVAGAAQETKIRVSDTSGTSCFALTEQAACAGPIDLTVETGDTVTWDFAGATMPHNVAADAKNPSDEPDDRWKKFVTQGSPPFHNPGSGGTDSYTFDKPGVYRYVCQLHADTMKGTITVKGQPVESPEPSVTAEPTVSATPTAIPAGTATATPDDHTSTPKPGSAGKDTVAPSLQRASAKPAKGGVRVRFRLSEPAKVSIELVRKGTKRSSVSKVVQSPAGTRAFVLRTRALKRGRYTVKLTAVDAMGNKGVTVNATLRVK
jgi:plastocyanin